MTRKYLQREVLGSDCPVLYHTGPAGNQSPRHLVARNNFSEAEKAGRLLGRAIAKTISRVHYATPLSITSRQEFVELPPRSFPSVEQAQAALELASVRLKQLQAAGAPRQNLRTAEVDWFGAGETVTLARAAGGQRLSRTLGSCMPAEIQMIKIGPWTFVGWPGEIFVEYALAVKARAKNTYVISLANGELQGYVATEEAAAEGAYEAANALFAPAGGTILVKKTLQMLAACGR
jgi:hypothetical protein